MVIELSGVQFGLKSYARFQNQTSAQHEFNLKSQVHDTKFIYNFITPFWDRKIQSLRYRIF